jgi:hypothetical protein
MMRLPNRKERAGALQVCFYRPISCIKMQKRYLFILNRQGLDDPVRR